MKIQPRHRGYTRRPYSTSVIQAIERKVEQECKRYDVSRAFVIANALAFVFNIDVEPYIEVKLTKSARKRTRARTKAK